MNQKKIIWLLGSFLFVGTALLTGCSHDMDDYQKKTYDVTDDERVRYAEKKLGVTIDPEQDWELTSEFGVRVKADANLEGISKILILDGNPYAGVVHVLAQQTVTPGASSTLTFRGPSGAEYFYAACVSNRGKCVARPFVGGEETEVSFVEVPKPYVPNGKVARRVEHTEIVGYPTTANFRVKDFFGLRNSVFAHLPEGKDNRAAFDDSKESIYQIRVKENEYNFYDLPLVFMGGIGKPNFGSDIDNLSYIWFPFDPSVKEECAFILKDKFENAYQPKYEKDTKAYVCKGIYLMSRTENKELTTQFEAGEELQFQLAYGEELPEDALFRIMVFCMNDNLFLVCEDGDDWDFNDRIFYFPYGMANVQNAEEPFEPYPSQEQIWTYAWEDQDFGDYDLNDCVIEVQENADDKSLLDITLVALGATRELWLGFENKKAKSYADYIRVFDQELHSVLGIPTDQMANTGNNSLQVKPVKTTITKPEGFDFQKCSFILGARVPQDMRGIYESDYYAISIARKGQDPHGIAIPSKWQWPTEKTCITTAYPQFADWAHDIADPTSKNWYMYPNAGEVVGK